MKKLIILLILLAHHCIGLAQTHNIDSLILKIKVATNDSVKIDLYNKLAWKYIFSDKIKALKTLTGSEKIARKKGQAYGYNSLLNLWAVYYDVNGQSDSAKYFFEKALAFSRKRKFKIHEEHSLNNLGMYSWNIGQYEKALEYYFESLALTEKGEGDDINQRKDACYNNIGLVYQDMELYPKAIAYHNKALSIRLDKKNNQGLAATYNNLGICYSSLGKYDQAKQFFEKSIQSANKTEDKTGYYKATQGLANIYAIKNDTENALQLYLASYSRPSNIPMNNNEKINITSGISVLYTRLGQYKNAIAFGEICVTTINADSSTDYKETEVYQSLATAYAAIGNRTKGEYYNQKFYESTALKFKETSAKALQELETKYETQKKELSLQKSEAANKQKNRYIFSALGLALLLGLIGYLVYKQQRIRNEQLVKENELKQALAKIEHQNNLHEQRLAISKELHDNIGSQLTFIISSLDNLKQFDVDNEPMFDKINSIGGFTRDTITDLRDTIWAMNKVEITVNDLKERTTQFIQRAQKSVDSIDFKFKYPAKAEHPTVQAKLGIDVYRIIQEAVNNAVKHAKASEITVQVTSEKNKMNIAITDNGVGFDQRKNTEGYGLLGMQSRADKIGAELAITSSDEGTTVNLEVAI